MIQSLLHWFLAYLFFFRNTWVYSQTLSSSSSPILPTQPTPPQVVNQYNVSIYMNLNGATGRGHMWVDSKLRRSLQHIGGKNSNSTYEIKTFLSDTTDEGKYRNI